MFKSRIVLASTLCVSLPSFAGEKSVVLIDNKPVAIELSNLNLATQVKIIDQFKIVYGTGFQLASNEPLKVIYHDEEKTIDLSTLDSYAISISVSEVVPSRNDDPIR